MAKTPEPAPEPEKASLEPSLSAADKTGRALLRHFAQQAGIDFVHNMDFNARHPEYCRAWTHQQYDYAELVVKECILEVLALDQAGNSGAPLTAKNYAAAIAKRFDLAHAAIRPRE